MQDQGFDLKATIANSISIAGPQQPIVTNPPTVVKRSALRPAVMVESKPTTGVAKIHNVRFYNLTPRSINYLAYNARFGRLAVSRTDASIEIWNMLHAGYLEKCILGRPQNSVEAVAWAGERLFSTGTTGELIEWDLLTLQPKQSVLLTGNAAWCLAVNRAEDHIAVGTEEGHVNLFQVDEYGLNYVKIFDKQDGRILCCRFDHSGTILVTGSVDCLRIWDVRTGHAIHRMATGRSEAARETLVWSLAVLHDLTIIAGDSRGRITIWDGKLGAQIESFAALKADVLSVAVSDDETVFSCSGIDPIIKMYVLTPVKRDQQITNTWIKYIQRAVHDHDVKALTFGPGDCVYSGGIDGYLGVSQSAKTKQKLVKYGPFLPQPCAVAAPEQRLLLLKYFNYVEVWRLGTPSDAVQLCDEDETTTTTTSAGGKNNATAKYLSLKSGLEKLVEMRSYQDQPVLGAAISPDGRWLVYTTESVLRLFQLRVTPNGEPTLQRMRDVPDEFAAAVHVRFAADSRSLLIVSRDGILQSFGLSDSETGAEDVVELQATVDTRKVIKGTVSMATVSQCGVYLVVVGTCGTIAVYKEKSGGSSVGWKHFLNLPKYKLAPTAIALHANRPLLVAAFSDSKIFEYHLEEMRFTCSSHKRHVDNTDTHAVNNIVLDPHNENIIMLHNDTFLYVLEKYTTGGSVQKDAKAARLQTNGTATTDDDEEPPVAELRLKFSKQFEHFVHLSRLSDDGELVAVGVNPVTLIEQLPPSMRQKKFGAA